MIVTLITLTLVITVWFGLVWLVGFLTSSSTTILGYIADRPQDKSVWQSYVLPHMRQSWETMTSVSAGHIINDDIDNKIKTTRCK